MRIPSLIILSIACLVLFAGTLRAAPPDRVTPAELKTMLDNNEPVVLIDVRSPEEFAAGHIPGSVSIPVDTIEGVASLPTGRRIILYCKAGKRTQRAFEILSGKGFTGLSVLDGGLDAWKASGGKVDTSPEPQKYNLPSPFHLNAGLSPQAGPR